MANTIALKGDFVRKEAEASAGITPGHMVEFTGDDVQVHASAGGVGRKAFALENDLVGDGIADAYVVGDTVQYGVFESGAEINAWLNYGENVAKGAALVSAGDGTLAAVGSGEDASIVAYAMEAVDNSSGGVDVRIEVEAA